MKTKYATEKLYWNEIPEPMHFNLLHNIFGPIYSPELEDYQEARHLAECEPSYTLDEWALITKTKLHKEFLDRKD